MKSIKWKTVETIMPNYPDGVVIIKEDTETELPIAVVPFPMGGHKEGVKKQRERSELMAAAPKLLESLEKLTKAVGPLDDVVLGEKYADVVIAFDEATKLIKCIKEE